MAHILQRVHNEIIDATKGSQRPVVQGPDSSLMLRLDDPAVTAGTPLGRDIISHEQLFRQSKDTYDEIIDGLEQHPATIPSPTGAGQDGESLASSRVAESQAHDGEELQWDELQVRSVPSASEHDRLSSCRHDNASSSVSAATTSAATCPTRHQQRATGHRLGDGESHAPVAIRDGPLPDAALALAAHTVVELESSKTLRGYSTVEGTTNAFCIGFCPTYEAHAALHTCDSTVASVQLLLTALVKRCHITARGTVSGAGVTVECILRKVTELALELQSGALVVIYFCGHGGEYGGKSCLVADDGTIMPARLLASIVLKQVVEQRLTDVRLVLVFDCARIEMSRVEGDTPAVGLSDCMCLTLLACYRRRALQAESELPHIRGIRRGVHCERR